MMSYLALALNRDTLPQNQGAEEIAAQWMPEHVRHDG